MESSEIRVLIADDHAVVRKGLAMVLDLEQDITIVGEAENGEQATRMAGTLQPDVVLLDRVMPGKSGFETIQEIKRVAPETRILMLTGTELDSTVMKLLSQGLDGYVLKDVEPEELKEAIRTIAGGEAYLQPAVARHMIDALVISAQVAEQDILTAREMEVLNCMATSATYREIASELYISEETVRSHAKSILRKLNQSNREAAVNEAIRLGILSKLGD